MLRSLYVMLDYHLAAADGQEGRVQDFLFDDESWIVHYLVVETPTPMGIRNVLILPFAAGHPDWKAKQLSVLLTCEQIRTSPPLEADMPISRQRELGLPVPHSHLRSVREVLGYSLHTTDGTAGCLDDFIVEDTLWGVHHAVVALQHPEPRSILLPPESIRTISWSAKGAWVNLCRQDLAQRPDFDPATPVNRDPEHRIFDYYGRPVYQPPAMEPSNRPEQQQQ